MTIQPFFYENAQPRPDIDQDVFTAWDCLRALTAFDADFGGVPKDLRVKPGGRLSRTQQELYTDLLDARAGGQLDALLTDFRQYIEDGVWSRQ